MRALNRVAAWTALAAVVVAVVGSALSGCAAASPKPANAQQVAAQSVKVAADAWNLAASSCLALAGVTDAGAANPTLAHECAVVLQPIHDAIIGAQVAVSVWDNVAQANFPCLMQSIATGLSDAVVIFHAPPAVADAALIALQFSHGCGDAGK